MLGLTHQAAPLRTVGALDAGPEFARCELAGLAEASARLDLLRLAPWAAAEGGRQHQAQRKVGVLHELGIALAVTGSAGSEADADDAPGASLDVARAFPEMECAVERRPPGSAPYTDPRKLRTESRLTGWSSGQTTARARHAFR
jgi:hypothetical protein